MNDCTYSLRPSPRTNSAFVFSSALSPFLNAAAHSCDGVVNKIVPLGFRTRYVSRQNSRTLYGSPKEEAKNSMLFCCKGSILAAPTMDCMPGREKALE